MRIVNLSYVSIKEYDDPESWLKRINYFTGILEQIAKVHTVINFHSIQFKGVVTKNGVEYHFLPLTLFQRWFPFSLHSYILALKPDVIIVHGLLFPWQVWQLQRRLNPTLPLFIQHHAERPLKGLRRLFQRMIDARVHGYFFSSKELGLTWIQSGLIADDAKIHEVMEISSVFTPVDKDKARAQTRVAGNEVYLWVGNLTENKDPLTLITAFRELLIEKPLVKLYLIYQSTLLLDKLKVLLDHSPELKKSIFLVGKIPHEEMANWYCSVDFIISTSHYEGSGTAVCEAMSCGCIPILSDIPSFRMMTNNGSCGYLFPPGNAEALTMAMKRSLIADREEAKAKAVDRFRSKLSFEAIAKTIIQTVSQPAGN